MIAVIDFGMGNIHSCLKAISLYTEDYKLITNPDEVENASGVVLPGDGAFQKAMSNLNDSGFTAAIKSHVEKEKPIFGICIGFQLLFEDSEESLEDGNLVKGFGFIRGHVRKFQSGNYKVPHMGWNKIHFSTRKEKKILKDISNGSYMYFIHSYRPVEFENSATAATCNYAEENFPVIIEKGMIFGTQFHPEKSDKEGLKILKNFIELAK